MLIVTSGSEDTDAGRAQRRGRLANRAKVRCKQLNHSEVGPIGSDVMKPIAAPMVGRMITSMTNLKKGYARSFRMSQVQKILIRQHQPSSTLAARWACPF